MFCLKCQNDLADCVCEDLPERLAAISSHVVFGADYARDILKQVQKIEGERDLKNVGKEKPKIVP